MSKRNKWTCDEIIILKENYSKGLKNIINLIPNHTKASIQKKSKRLGLKVDKDNLYYNLEKIIIIVKESISFAEVFRKLNKSKSGDSYKSFKSFIERNNIDTSHFDPWKNNRFKNVGNPISYWLKEGTNINSSTLKEKLYKEGLKERKCEKCGQGEIWKGKKMSLILDHINGINNDNRIENLRIVCPNCNGTLETHCRGKIGLEYKKQKYDCVCGNKKSKRSKKCRKCDAYNQRKVKRPNIETILKEIKELGYTGTGKKYNVSDNTIRNWIT